MRMPEKKRAVMTARPPEEVVREIAGELHADPDLYREYLVLVDDLDSAIRRVRKLFRLYREVDVVDVVVRLQRYGA